MDFNYYKAHREIADFYGEVINLLGAEEGFEWLSRTFESLDMDSKPYRGSLEFQADRLFKRHADVDLRAILESLGTLDDTRYRIFYLGLGHVVQLPWGPVQDRTFDRSTYMKGIVVGITEESVTVIVVPEQQVTDPVLDRSFKIAYDRAADQAIVSAFSPPAGIDRHSMSGALQVVHLPRSEDYAYGLKSADLTQEGGFRPGSLYVKQEDVFGSFQMDVVIPVRVCSPPPDGLGYIYGEPCQYTFFRGFGRSQSYEIVNKNGWRELCGPPR